MQNIQLYFVASFYKFYILDMNEGLRSKWYFCISFMMIQEN